MQRVISDPGNKLPQNLSLFRKNPGNDYMFSLEKVKFKVSIVSLYQLHCINRKKKFLILSDDFLLSQRELRGCMAGCWRVASCCMML